MSERKTNYYDYRRGAGVRISGNLNDILLAKTTAAEQARASCHLRTIGREAGWRDQMIMEETGWSWVIVEQVKKAGFQTYDLTEIYKSALGWMNTHTVTLSHYCINNRAVGVCSHTQGRSAPDCGDTVIRCIFALIKLRKTAAMSKAIALLATLYMLVLESL